jgi:hypothetical protein
MGMIKKLSTAMQPKKQLAVVDIWTPIIGKSRNYTIAIEKGELKVYRVATKDARPTDITAQFDTFLSQCDERLMQGHALWEMNDEKRLNAKLRAKQREIEELETENAKLRALLTRQWLKL